MTNAVKLVECPRDAWQGMPVPIPAQAKAAYLRGLIDAGFKHIDAVSFVSAAAVPQMADSEQVLELLGDTNGVEIIGIVVNRKGAERAIQTHRVITLGFPYSISAEFLERNQRQTQQQALKLLEEVHRMAGDAGLGVVAYISMAFGNPYGEQWSVDLVRQACISIAEIGIRQISLADTVGVADDVRVAQTVEAAITALPQIEVGVHLHARRDAAAMRVRAAYNVGCRRYDSALGGLGGCPFAQDALVGNLPTEILVVELARCGADVPRLEPLDTLIGNGAEIAAAAEAHS